MVIMIWLNVVGQIAIMCYALSWINQSHFRGVARARHLRAREYAKLSISAWEEEEIMTTQVQPSPLLGQVLADLAEHWWLLLLRGIAAIAFGVLTFFWPGLTLLVLIFLWGIYAIADGILALWAAIAGQGLGKMAPRWWLAIVGLSGIAAGILTFIWPGMTALVLLMFI